MHVIDPLRIRESFCARLLGRNAATSAFDSQNNAQETWAMLTAALGDKDIVAAAQTIAQGAIRFMAAELPAHYERGFCLSLWSWRMEDDALVAQIPKKHRGSAADLDTLFAPLVDAYPRLRGRWPTESAGNFSVGVFVPAEKVSGLLKWTKNKITRYPRASRRLFRGLLLVLEECERRGLAYWEASDVADVHHPIEIPEHLRTSWLEEVRLPRKGTWQVIANVAMPGRPPLCVFDFSGVENFKTEQPACAVADLATWPPSWIALDESMENCDRGRDGMWLVEGRRERDQAGFWRSAPRVVELREKIDAPGTVIDVPMTPAAWGLLKGYSGPNGPAPSETPFVEFVAMIGGECVLTVGTGPRRDTVPPFRPYLTRGRSLIEAAELPATMIWTAFQAVVRLSDGGEVLFWVDKGYELVAGQFKATFVPVPKGWDTRSDFIAAVGEDAILAQAYQYEENKGALFLSRRKQEARQVAPAVENLSELSAGPAGSVLARQVGRSPKHLGCILWPEQDEHGTVLWLDDDLFPDEDPDNIRKLLWSETAGRLIAVTTERLWAVPIERVLKLPRYDATTGTKLRQARS